MTAGDRSEGDVNWSVARRSWGQHLGGRTRDLLAEDERYFIRQSLSTPCLDVVESAHGAVLVDSDGREILDFHGNSAHQVGYGHPRVVAEVKRALDRLPFSPRRYTNTTALELARRLAGLAPGELGKVLFAPSGAAAMGMALKLARYATGRHKTVSMWESFHGANLDTISVGGEALFRQGAGPLLPGTEHVPPVGLAERFFGNDGHAFDRLADYVDYVLEVQGDVAALVAEPVRWTTLDLPSAEFWPRVRESCDRHGVLLVFDEVPSCLGRTGEMFACQNFATVPDILVIGKGLGGGVMPMAAVIARPSLDVVPEGALGHYTHEKSPVGAAAALATLDVIEEEGLVERSRALGATTLALLQGLVPGSSVFRQARGLGMSWAVEVGPLAGHPAAEVADRLLYASLERGLSFKVGGAKVATLCPPLNIPEAQLSSALGIFDEAGRAVAAALTAGGTAGAAPER
jgi:4-aminobutyrate aminotransferase